MLHKMQWVSVSCIFRTTPKLKISDFGVIFPLRASGAMYAQVPTILSVIMVVDVPLVDALVRPKSEILAINVSSNRIFALHGREENTCTVKYPVLLHQHISSLLVYFIRDLFTSLWTWWLRCKYSKPLAVPSAMEHLCLQVRGRLLSYEINNSKNKTSNYSKY